MIHKKTSKPAFVADLLVKIIKYLYGRDVVTSFVGCNILLNALYRHDTFNVRCEKYMIIIRETNLIFLKNGTGGRNFGTP